VTALLFGLATEERVGRVTVVWPWGDEQHWDGPAVNRYWRLIEEEAEAQDARVGRHENR
jgi:hypothetical protein